MIRGSNGITNLLIKIKKTDEKKLGKRRKKDRDVLLTSIED